MGLFSPCLKRHWGAQMDSGTVDSLAQPASPFAAPKDLRGRGGEMKRLQSELEQG